MHGSSCLVTEWLVVLTQPRRYSAVAQNHQMIFNLDAFHAISLSQYPRPNLIASRKGLCSPPIERRAGRLPNQDMATGN